jgi:FMN phosphatase YigB (HAD superfamily)
MIDDLPHTTRAAKELGMFSILMNTELQNDNANAHLTDWAHLHDILEKQ